MTIAVVMVDLCANASWWEYILMGCYMLPFVKFLVPIVCVGIAGGLATSMRGRLAR